MNSEKLIDLTYLKRISKGDNLFIEKTILMLLEQTRQRLFRLEEYFNKRDWKGVQASAHQLKTSFNFLGVKEIPDIIKNVEVYALNKTNLDLLPEMILKIRNATLT